MINYTTATNGNKTKTFKNPTPTRTRFNIFKLLSAFAFVMLLGVNGVMGQTTIASQDFESSPGTPTLTFSNTNGTNSTGTNGSGIPASANLFVSGSRGWQSVNTTSTLTFANQSLSGYTNAFIDFRLAGMSVNGTNGIDGADLITVSISVDGGTTYSSELTIGGSASNQRWDFTASGTSTITYDGNNTPTAVTSSTGSGGISTVTINIPNVNTQVRVRIAMKTNDTDERYVIDDVRVRGTVSSSPTITVGTLNEFNTSATSTPSAEQTLVVSGSNLTNDIVITPPTGFEISTTTGGSFSATNPITLTQTSGTVANTNIYVRYNPATLAVQPQVAGTNITATSTGASTQNVTVLGSVRNLSQGDFALIGFNASTTDALSFVALTSIPANTIIKFTDNGYSDATTQMLTEGYLIYTAPSTISAGTVVSWNNGMNISGTGWNSNAPTNFSLNGTGEQLFVYQGTWGVSGGTTTLHQGFMTGGTWTTSGSVASVTTNSYLPTVLTTGTSAADFALANAYYTNNTINTENTKSTIFTKSSTAASWTTNGSLISTPAWVFNIIADEPTTQPSFSSATSVGNNQMSLNFSGGNGTSYMVVMREGSAVSATPTDATNYSTVSGSVNFSTATELSAGQRIVYNGTTSTGTVTVTNLSAGTTYHYAIYAYNGTTTTANFYLTTPGTGNQLTTGSANSNVSDIIIHASFTEPTNIAYASTQENSNLTVGTSVEVAQFTLRDGGATTDADANSTTLNSITFTIAGHTNLRRLALYDGSTELSEVAISTGTATFSGLTLAAVDNSSKDFSLRASFAGTVTDNSQFSFTVSSATADVAGSTFALASAGAAASSISGDRNRIEVSTTAIIINQNVSNVTVGVVMSPSPSVTALDNLANFDLDNTSNVTMTITTGTTTFDGAATTTVAMVAGTATFTNLVFSTTTNSNRLTATQGGFTDLSSFFNVISGPVTLVAGDIAVIGYNTAGGSFDDFAILVLKDLTAGTNFYVNDNEVSTLGGTSFTDLAEVEAKFTVKAGQTISAGTVIQLPWGAAAVSTSTYDFTTTSGAGFGSNNEEIYIYNATAITDQTPTSFIYFAKIGSSSSSIPAGLTSAITSNAPSGVALMYKTSGATYSGCTSTLLSSIGNTGSNWTSTSVPSPLVPANWTFSSITSSANNWTGGTSTWNTGANWSCTTIPNIIDNITITSGNPTLDIDFTLVSGKSLTISNTGTFTINPTRTLTIAGTADFGGKLVTVKSDGTGTGSIGQIKGTLSNATNVNVERYIPAKRAWRFLGAPLIGGSNNSIFYNWQNNGSAVANYGVELWSPLGTSAPSSSNSGLAYYFGGTSIKEYTNNAWSSLTNTTTSKLFDGNTNNAYSVFVTGPFTTDGSGNINTGSSATTLSATGTLIQGTHVKTLTPTAANQYFLVANPYASSVSPLSITLSSNIANNFYMWDPNCVGSYNVGQYNNYSRVGGTYSLVGGGTVYTNSTAIQSGQAFFVQVTDNQPATITFNESNKVSGSTNVFRTTSTNVQTLRHTLKKSINGVVTNIDGALGIFYNGGNATVDYNDAAKFSNSTENIALRRTNGSYAIEERPSITDKDTLFVRLTNTLQSAYTLELTGENFTNTPGLTATLKDAYTNSSLPLSITDTNRYNFAVDANAASTGDRFMIVFKTNSTLPVQFTHINATQKGASVQVDWKVTTEQNIKQYVVEKSTNGINFVAIATQAANNINNSSYTAMDNSPITGSNYYRVLSTDNNGKQQYSNVAVVKIGGKQSSISVYPNPIAGNVMNLQLENIAKGNYTIQLVNTQGSVVMQTKLQHAGGSGTQSIDLPNTLSSGNYVLKATADNGVVFTEKVVLSSKF